PPGGQGRQQHGRERRQHRGSHAADEEEQVPPEEERFLHIVGHPGASRRRGPLGRLTHRSRLFRRIVARGHRAQSPARVDVDRLSMMSRISNTRSMNAGSRCISFGGRSGDGTSISRRIVPGDDEKTYTRSPRYTASSIECVTKKTVACASLHKSTSSACMCSRVVGSRAPNGSPLTDIPGAQMSVLAV